MTYTTTHRQKTLNNPKRKFFFFGVWVVSLTSFVGGSLCRLCRFTSLTSFTSLVVPYVVTCFFTSLGVGCVDVFHVSLFRVCYYVCKQTPITPTQTQKPPNPPTYYEKNETKHLPLKQTTKKKLLRLGVWLCHSIYIVTCVTCVDCFVVCILSLIVSCVYCFRSFVVGGLQTYNNTNNPPNPPHNETWNTTQTTQTTTT